MTDYRNPDLSLAELIPAAAYHPWDVELNPVLPLLALEDPQQFAVLINALVAGWREEGVRALSDQNQRLYACDCAERVLPEFESEYPGDLRPRNTINVARRFAQGDATPHELRLARETAKRAQSKAKGGPAQASIAAGAAAETASPSPLSAAREAANDARNVAREVGWRLATSGYSDARFNAAEAAGAIEMHWQSERVKFYY